MSTTNPQNMGEALAAAKEAAVETKMKNKAKRSAKKGVVRYIPGQSCVALKKEHDYVTRTAKSGRKYQVCKKCGSARMVKAKE